jgi:L-lysine exporter family protein LysE/ArgO
MLAAAVHGFVLAFGLILPLGVQNVFVFNQGASQPSFKRAVPVILTASLCDTILILMAVLGISVLVFNIGWLQTLLLAAGFIFLLYMGLVTWRAEPASDSKEAEAFSPKKQIAYAASVSLLNPHAIFDTIGVIGTSSIAYSGNGKAVFTFACILTSWLWFFLLAFIGRQAGRLGKSSKFMELLNKLSAVIIWGTAIILLLSLLKMR